LGTAAFLFDEKGVFGSVAFPKKVMDKDFLFSCPYLHGSVIFRRDILMQVGGYKVSRRTKRTEDYELFMRLQRVTRGENLTEPLYYFLENGATVKRRKYRYRIDEAAVRYSGFKRLGLLPRGLPYVAKPLLVGLIPSRLLKILKRKRRERRKNE
jgi:glycosyltransferase EpsE